MVLVYRVEKEGKGFYSASKSDTLRDFDWIHYRTWERHPGPDDDLPIKKYWRKYSYEERATWHFGFISLDHFHEWFDIENGLKLMHEDGFELCVYSISKRKVKEGESQCIFKIKEARKVKILSLLEQQSEFC